MSKKIVAMPLIPVAIKRAGGIRANLGYAKYAQATWRWWCEQHGMEFVICDEALGGNEFAQMPPTIQRWFIPELLIRKHGAGTRVAVVDADTMIRWDTPDFLAASHGFAAARGTDMRWIARSIRAFQPLFPGVTLPWWEYFNAGVVVLGEGQLSALRAFLEFASRHWPQLNAAMLSQDVGTDQTPLNFVLRRESQAVELLAPPFNLVHCFPVTRALAAIDRGPSPDPILFA